MSDDDIVIEPRNCEFLGGPLCGQTRVMRIPLEHCAAISVAVHYSPLWRRWEVCTAPGECPHGFAVVRYVVIEHQPSGGLLTHSDAVFGRS